MSRYMFAIILIVFLLGRSSPLPLALPAFLPTVEDEQVHLPIIFQQYAIEVVVTTFNDSPYSYFYDALGYVENAAGESFEVTLEADVTVYPYSIDTPEPPYTKTVQFQPALDVSLPGQRNPFNLEAMCYKACEVITDIHLDQAIAWNNDLGAYLPLTIVDWTHNGEVLSGTVRNDSSQELVNARVVVTELVKCDWKEAVLETESLQPGEETMFTLDPYYSTCISDQMLIVGQGQAH